MGTEKVIDLPGLPMSLDGKDLDQKIMIRYLNSNQLKKYKSLHGPYGI
jgi:hypothetical protein